MKDKSKEVRGAGGGSSPDEGTRTPVIAPDSAQSKALLSLLDLIGEGQIKGLVNGDQSVIINGTPLGNADGSKNIQGLTWEFRDGRQDQDVIEGFPDVSTPFNVGLRVKRDVPYTFSVNDLNADQVRVIVNIPALSSQDSTTGDVSGTQVKYQFLMSVSNGPFLPVNVAGTTDPVVTINDKVRSQHQREHLITLPKPATDYKIRMVRITQDSESSYLANDTYLDSYYELQNSKLSYPNSVMFGMKVDASQFGQIPSRAYDVYGLYVQVPSNYDAETRAYVGTWDGSFKIAYTNNPAWILRDIMLNKRYGLGEYIKPSNINVGKLYTIARYCDGMVTDGNGGEEPRFTLNTVISARADAYKVIQDICSVFRGMAYWSGGMVQLSQDAPSDPQFLYTNANVVDGMFNRVGSQRKDRHSVVHVSWNDPTDQFKQKIEYVEDKALIESIGYRKMDTIAFGCTSRAQAHRIGLWILYTESVETNIMTFEVGLQGLQCAPGDIVKIHDQFKAGKRVGGRLKSATRIGCTLDAPLQVSPGSMISIQMPDGKHEERAVVGSGLKTELQFASQLSAVPEPNAVWVMAELNLVPQLARCVGVAQSDTKGQYIVSVVDHNPSKYASIEQSLQLQTYPTTVLDPTNSDPESIRIEEVTYLVSPGQIGTRLEVSWRGKSVRYNVSWRMTDGVTTSGWQEESANKASFELLNVSTNAIYDFSITGVSATGKLSKTLTGSYTTLGTMNPPQAPTNLVAEGDFAQINLKWDKAQIVDLDYVRIYENEVDDVNTAYYRDRSASETYIRTGIEGRKTYYYWVTSVNRRGQESAKNSTAGTKATGGYVSQLDIDPALLEKIELINAPGSVLGSVNQRTEALNDKINEAAEQAKIDLALVQANLSAEAANLDTRVEAVIDQADALLTHVDEETARLDALVDQAIVDLGLVEDDLAAAATELRAAVTDIRAKATAETTRLNGLVAGINAEVDEVQARAASESIRLDNRVNAVTNTLIETNQGLTNVRENLSAEVSRLDGLLDAAEADIAATQANAAAEIVRVNGLVTGINTKIDSANAAAIAESARLDGRVNTVAANVATVATNLTAEATRVDGLVAGINTAVAAVQASAAAEIIRLNGVRDNLASEAARLDTRVNGVQTAAAATKTALEAADAALTTRMLAAETAIINEATSRKDADSSMAETLKGVIVTQDGNTASIGQLQRVTAEANALSAIQFEAINVSTAGSKASIRTEESARVDGDSALAIRATAIEASVVGVNAAITTEQQARADQDTALASQIGELSAKVDALPQFASGFEPGTDFDQWTVGASDTITPITTGQYAGYQSAKLTSTFATAPSVTTATRATIAGGLTAAFDGFEVVVKVAAIKPAGTPSTQFAVMYHAGSAGNSTWQYFTPTSSWAEYEFRYTVPAGSKLQTNQVLLWADTSGAGKGLIMDSIRVSRASGEVAAITAAIVAEQVARATADTALASELNALTARTTASEAAITAEQSARATSDSAIATNVTALTTRMGSAEAGITAEQTARSTADAALASRATSLEARTASSEAAITAEQTARTTADAALTTSVNGLTARIDTSDAAIVTEQQARATADEAITTNLTALTTRVGTAESAIVSEQTARTTADLALTTSITGLTTRVGSNEAAITAEQTARTTADAALAVDIAAVNARVGTSEASVATETAARVTADAALASSITTLAARTTNAEAGLVTEAKTRADETGALAQRSSLTEAAQGANKAAITELTRVQAESDLLQAVQVSALEVSNQANKAGIYNERDVRVTEDEALATQIVSLTATVTTNKTTSEAAVTAEQTARATADTALASSITALTTRVGTAEASVTAETAARVTADSALSTSIAALNVSSGNNNAAITAEQTARVNADEALASDITGLKTRVGNSEAVITAEQAARTTADTALTTSVNGLSARVGTAEAGLVTEQQARASADATLTSNMTALTGRVGTAESAIVTEQTARTTADTAITTSVTALTTRVGTAESAITAEQTARTTADTALTTSVNGLSARVGTAEAAITSEQTARANADSAQVTSINGLSTRMGTAEAAITAETTARTTADAATASQLSSMKTTMDGNTAAIAAETTARTTADSALTTSVNSITARTAASEAAITAEQTARANADSALTTSVNGLSARVGTTEAAITA